MGYCQGLNFITGNLLLILSQEQTYNTMFHILYWQKHEFLMSDMGYIHEKIYCLDSKSLIYFRADQEALSQTLQDLDGLWDWDSLVRLLLVRDFV